MPVANRLGVSNSMLSALNELLSTVSPFTFPTTRCPPLGEVNRSLLILMFDATCESPGPLITPPLPAVVKWSMTISFDGEPIQNPFTALRH
jgi:hypothetical protein